MKKLIIIAGIIVIAGFFAYKFLILPSESGLGTLEVQNIDGTPLSPEEERAIEQQREAVVSDTRAERYMHLRLGFSFDKPQGYTVGSILGDDGTETLVVQPVGGSVASAFQIYITPLDEPLTLTPELVMSELPGTTVSNPQKIILDGKGQGMMFASNNDAFSGKSFEIWFVADGNLYQVTSYSSFTDQLKGIIGTWKFD